MALTAVAKLFDRDLKNCGYFVTISAVLQLQLVDGDTGLVAGPLRR